MNNEKRSLKPKLFTVLKKTRTLFNRFRAISLAAQDYWF